MSADNYIAVQKRKGDWWVWMECASADKPFPHGVLCKSFFRKYDALAYAMERYKEEAIVEYGIVLLPKLRKKK